MKMRRGLPPAVVRHVNVTPLIDIMLVLIIFFMLVAHIGVTTGAEPMKLPQSIRGARLRDMNNTLTLNIHTTPAGPFVTALVNGEKQQLNVGERAATPALLDVLRYFRFGPDAFNPKDNSQFKVIIRADKDMPYQSLQPILKACADAQVKYVNFTTLQQD